PVRPAEGIRAKRDQLERLAPFSSRHAEELRSVREIEAKDRRGRQNLEWCAQFSTDSETKLRKVLMEEAEAREGRPRCDLFTNPLRESGWDSSKHPRGGYSENRGWFSPADGGGAGHPGIGGGGDLATNAPGIPQPKAAEILYDASNPFVPTKGTWAGE